MSANHTRTERSNHTMNDAKLLFFSFHLSTPFLRALDYGSGIGYGVQCPVCVCGLALKLCLPGRNESPDANLNIRQTIAAMPPQLYHGGKAFISTDHLLHRRPIIQCNALLTVPTYHRIVLQSSRMIVRRLRQWSIEESNASFQSLDRTRWAALPNSLPIMR